MGNDESLQFDGDVTIVFWVRPENVVLSEDEITQIMEDGLEDAFDVSPSDKLATTWANIKR